MKAHTLGCLKVCDPNTRNSVSQGYGFFELGKWEASKPWIPGEESDREIAEILPARESVFDPENPNNNLGSTPSIDEDDVYVDSVRQVPFFPV